MFPRMALLLLLVPLLYACSMNHPPAKAGPQDVEIFWGRWSDPPPEGWNRIERIEKSYRVDDCPSGDSAMPAPDKLSREQADLVRQVRARAAR